MLPGVKFCSSASRDWVRTISTMRPRTVTPAASGPAYASFCMRSRKAVFLEDQSEHVVLLRHLRLEVNGTAANT